MKQLSIKKIRSLFIIFICVTSVPAAFAQLRGINYQAVAIDENGFEVVGMDISGQAIKNKTIAVRFSILSGSPAGPVLYQETHATGTDRYGLFSLIIGDGAVTSLGQYQLMVDIPWATANQFLKVEIDLKNDGDYKLMSIQQFMAVPYSFYALKSDTAQYALNSVTPAVASWALTGNDSTIAGTNFIGTTNNADFVIKTNNIEKMRVSSGGNLGIGTSNPSGLLSVGDSSGFQVGSTGAIDTATGINSSGVIRFSGLAPNGIVRSTGGNGTLSSSGGQINLSSEVINNLPISNGGTGLTSLGNWQAFYSDGSGALTPFALGDSGKVFQSNGPALAPSWVTSSLSLQPLSNGTGISAFTYDGTAAATVNLANTGVTPGTYGSTMSGTVITIPSFIVNAQGQLTGTSTAAVNAETPLTFSNGLTRTVDTVQLGGPLTQNTTITGGTFNTIFDLNGTGNFSINKNGNSSAFFVKSDDGFIGIGTAAPTSPLTIQTLVGNEIEFTGSLNADITANTQLNINSLSSIHLGTNNSTRLAISTSGNVGIGTATPAEKLEVTGNVRVSNLAGTGTRMVQTDLNGTLIPLPAGNATQVLLGTGVWGNVSDTSAWSLSGNAGTVDGTHFIGTTDSIPFNIRVNNQKAGRIDHMLSNTFFGYTAGNLITTGNFNTANGAYTLSTNSIGQYNTAYGSYALNANTGSFNSAFGVFALSDNITGIFNTGIGVFALTDNTTGDYNTATGMYSLFSNLGGSENTANGYEALKLNTTGAWNTAIGSKALYSNTASRNTAIGAYSLYSNTTGDYNTANGFYALYANTTGVQNTANGMNALSFNTTGNYNTANGMQALYENTTGFQNTANGMNTLRFNTTGNYNTATGLQALYSNVSGNSNTASGSYSLYSNSAGNDNTASGFHALYSNTLGGNNTALGDSSLFLNTTGNMNTVNGFQALYSNVAGSYATAIGARAMQYSNNISLAFDNFNVAVGYEALRGSTSPATNIGTYNTATGYQTLKLNSSGSYNTANGSGALTANTVGSYNTAIGGGALEKNIGGSLNTAVGSGALNANLTGLYNTAIGSGALYLNTVGEQNTATGAGALYSNLSGRFNTAAGNGALYNNIGADKNSAFGEDALKENISGYNNTASGVDALRDNTVGFQNTANGMNALKNNINGENNTALGFNAFNSGTGFSNSTALGYDAQITANNTIQLGNTNITDVKTSGTVSANGYTTAFITKSADYTLSSQDDIISATGTTIITLPSAAGITGRKYTIKNSDALLTVTVNVTGTETIDGAAQKLLTVQYQYVTVVSDGTNWLIVAEN